MEKRVDFNLEEGHLVLEGKVKLTFKELEEIFYQYSKLTGKLAKAKPVRVATAVHDFTWSVCQDCLFREKRHVTSESIFVPTQVREAYDVMVAWICTKGLNRDRNPNFCSEKIRKEEL